MEVRRVVTGTSPGGKAVFASDEVVAPITVGLMPGIEFLPLWGSDHQMILPTDGTQPDAPAYFPPAGGFRFGFVSIPPEGQPPEGRALPDVEEVELKLPGLLSHMEPDHPGMHTTDTIDFNVVVSGEIFVELDDGAEVHVKAGDCVIQNGARHAWHNRSSEPCVLAVTIVGASRGLPDT
ncbi:MAG TPA: cupin domain-containing protein [Acidimicrobiia bacterium]